MKIGDGKRLCVLLCVAVNLALLGMILGAKQHPNSQAPDDSAIKSQITELVPVKMLLTEYASEHGGRYPTFHSWGELRTTLEKYAPGEIALLHRSYGARIHLNASISGFDIDHGKNIPIFYSDAVDGRAYAVCTQDENGPIYSRLSDEEVRRMKPQPLGVQ